MLDDKCGFRLKPNAFIRGIPGIITDVQINSLGMRDKEYPKVKPQNTFRILALGDSFAFGRVDYQHNFLSVTEDSLNQSIRQPQVEILNTGVPAYQPVNELAYLEEYGWPFQPDMALLCFYVGNDFFDNDKPATYINPDVSFKKENDDLQKLTFYRYLSWSKLYNLYVTIRIKLSMNADVKKRLEQISHVPQNDNSILIPSFYFMDENQYQNVLKTQIPLFQPAAKRHIDTIKAFESTAVILRKIKTVCADKKIPLWVIEIPAEAQVDPIVQTKAVELNLQSASNGGLDFDEPQKTLNRFLEQENINAIDLLPVFKQTGLEKRLYLLQDTHWNEDGNHVAASIMAEYLIKAIQP